MPGDQFLDNPMIGPAGVRDWDDETLVQLSRRWGVSREAVLRRLVTLNRASYEFYRIKRQEYLAAYAAQREEERDKRRGSTGGPPPYRMAVRDRGKPYVRLVLDLDFCTLCGGESPGLLDFQDFLGCGWSG